MNPRWVFIVTFTDRQYHTVCERRFLHLRSAEEYAESLRRCGFFRVNVQKLRYRVNQKPECKKVLGPDQRPPAKKVLLPSDMWR